MFSLVPGALLRALVNRDENRLSYIRQSAPGIGEANATFSVPEIMDLRSSVKTLHSFSDFSTLGFTMVGLGELRSVQARVVGGSYFPVMGLPPGIGAHAQIRVISPGLFATAWPTHYRRG